MTSEASGYTLHSLWHRTPGIRKTCHNKAPTKTTEEHIHQQQQQQQWMVKISFWFIREWFHIIIVVTKTFHEHITFNLIIWMLAISLLGSEQLPLTLRWGCVLCEVAKKSQKHKLEISHSLASVIKSYTSPNSSLLGVYWCVEHTHCHLCVVCQYLTQVLSSWFSLVSNMLKS